MKPQELRCGNLVLDYEGYTIETVQPSDFEGVWEEMHFQPIPLTEEWLLKFGARQVYSTTFHIRTTNGVIQIDLGSRVCFICSYDESECVKIAVFPEFVHLIQNLFYTIEGEELTIKEI